MFTSTKRFLRFIVILFRKNENLRKVHHILLVLYHVLSRYVCTYVRTYVSMCIHCVCNYVRTTCTCVCMYVCVLTFMYIRSCALETMW